MWVGSAAVCVDSDTYTDPVYGDSCSGWVGYACTEEYGLTAEEAAELQAQCPVSCQMPQCNFESLSCMDSDTYIDPVYSLGCADFFGYPCAEDSGFTAEQAAVIDTPSGIRFVCMWLHGIERED